MRLFIVGFSGAGKSTIGRRVAERLGYNFADTDDEIEQETGKSVAELFNKRGEAEFRRLERRALEKLSEQDNVIIATGGGLASWGDNMEWMKSRGTTLYMKLTPAQLAGRLSKGAWKRPLLRDKSGEELREYIEKLLAEREAYYLEANVVMDTNGVNDDYIVEHIEFLIES